MVLRSFLACLALVTSLAVVAQPDPCGTVTIDGPDRIDICLGDELTLEATSSLTGAVVVFSSASGFIDLTTGPSATLSPTASGFIRVTATAGTCIVSDSVFVDVDRLVVPTLIADGAFCQDEPIDLLDTSITDVGNSNYILLGGEDTIAAGRDPNFVVTLDQDSTFTLIARSDNGQCEESSSVSLTVIPGTFEITQDTVEACTTTEDSITLSVNTTATDVTWSPVRFNTTPPSGPSYTVRPTADITYYAEAVVNGCPRIDSVAVRLDSLPLNTEMTLDEEKDPYCQGDTFFVRSPVYDAGDFPLIMHEWTEAPGLQSPQDLYNGVFIAQDTAVLTRETTNGACERTDTIPVNVLLPPQVRIEPDTTVCPGEPVQVQATFETGSGTLEWEDPNGTLSCTDCLDPIAIVQMTTEYNITVETEASDCTSPLTYSIQVEPGISPELTGVTQICPGDSVQLIVDAIVPGYEYTISGGGIESDDPLVAVSPTETTTYTVVTVSDCGEDTQTITITVLEDYTVTANAPTAVCADEALQLSAVTDPVDLDGSYTWTLPNGTSRTGQSISVDDPTSGTYTVRFIDAFGCSSAEDVVEVNVIGQNFTPIITGVLEDGTSLTNGGAFFSGNTVTLSVANLPADQEYTFSWSGNYEPPTAEGETITVFVPRTEDDSQPEALDYSVTLTTVDGGCTFEGTIFLDIEQSRVQAPEFFTPDNDGRNDIFRLFFNGTITDFNLMVYNRWGQKVFTTDDPLEGWDGTKGGTPQNPDVYLYLAKFRQDGVELEREGQFSLLR